MKRRDLVERLMAYFPEWRKKDLEILVAAIFEELGNALKLGDRIEFRDFGRFEVHRGRERIFVNPKNKETYYLPGNQRLVFRVGKDLRERLKRSPRAVLDLGTQTFRMALGKKEGGNLRIVGRYRENVRLGENLKDSKEISPQAERRALEALKKFKRLLDQLEVSDYRAVGTAVFRMAKNSQNFIQKIGELGIKVEIISSERESDLVAKGVIKGLSLEKERFLLLDVGGGSTELVILDRGRKEWEVSLPLGVVSLRDQFIKTYPLTRGEYRTLRSYIREVISEISWPKDIRFVIGCGGSASLIGALDLKLTRYLPERLHGHQVSLDHIQAISDYLWGLSLSKIKRLRGMEEGREDIALPGLLFYLEILKQTSQSRLIISEWGLLEGLLLSF